MGRKFLYLMAVVAGVMLTGCASMFGNEIHVVESQKPNPNAVKVKYLASIRIAGYSDSRSFGNARKLGDSEERVTGMIGKDIMLDRDVTEIVADFMRKRLDDSGIQMLPKDDAGALFELSGVVRDLKLDVKARDQIFIRLETTLTEVASGKVIWSGEVEQKDERYAGSSGNSKGNIADYLKQQLGIVAVKTTEAVNAVLMATRPELFNLTPGTKAIAGVKVFVTPGVASPAQPIAPLVVPVASDSSQASATNGMLLVTTEPARAKVYLDGVYYGMSPLRVEATPGVHTVEIKLNGFKTASEKVSVRKGDKTELELVLEK